MSGLTRMSKSERLDRAYNDSNIILMMKNKILYDRQWLDKAANYVYGLSIDNYTDIEIVDLLKPYTKDIFSEWNILPSSQTNIVDSKNYKFYLGLYQPTDFSVTEILNEWWGDYQLLEERHDYIQWLFPNIEVSKHGASSPLTSEEIKLMSNSWLVSQRMLFFFDMMLDFYGMRVWKMVIPVPTTDMSTFIRKEKYKFQYNNNFEERLDNMVINPHNKLRVTRILKSMKVFDHSLLARAWRDHLIKGITAFDLTDKFQDAIKHWMSAV